MKLRNWFLAGVIIGVIISYYYVIRAKAVLIAHENVGIPVRLVIPALGVKMYMGQAGINWEPSREKPEMRSSTDM
jgi:hypothetical protein